METPAKKGNGHDDDPLCETCPYWFRRTDVVDGSGLCRLNPPVTQVMLAGRDRGGLPQYNLTPIYPSTAKDWWCGKHPDRDPQVLMWDMIGTVLEGAAKKLGISL